MSFSTGFGNVSRTVKTFINMGKTKVLTTHTLPNSGNDLKVQSANNPLADCILLVKLMPVIYS